MLKRIAGLDFLCKPTTNQYCCTSSHNYGDFVLNAFCSYLKRAEVTTLCCGWTVWVTAFERHRSGVERSVIRGLNLNFSSNFGFYELTKSVLTPSRNQDFDGFPDLKFICLFSRFLDGIVERKAHTLQRF